MPDHYTMSTVVADRLKLRHMLDLICKVIIALEIAEWIISMTALIEDVIFMQGDENTKSKIIGSRD